MFVRDESRVFRGCIWGFLASALIGVMVIGAVFGGYALFQTYGHAFSRLMNRDVQLAQQLYNDTVARQLKDTLLQQQIDLLNAELVAESMTREAGFLSLYYAILNETATRIAEEDILFSGLANETAARTAIDIFFAAEIANLTIAVEVAEAYEAFSKATFLAIIANITNLQMVLANEIAARIAGDALLTEQGALADATIAYLTTTLEHEIHDRTVQDVLIDEWIAALQALGVGIESINGQTGSINNNVDIVSTNELTTITVPSPGVMVFTNNALRTLQGIGPAGSGDITLSVGASLTIAPFGPHGLHIASTFVPIGPNEVTLVGFNPGVFSFSGMIGSNYLGFGCPFPFYNGGSCGWSAPDTGTYIVQISVAMTICVSSHTGPVPTVVHVNMGLARTTYNAAVANPRPFTENTGGVLDIVDGTFVGTAQITNTYCMDMGFSATTVVEGGGVAGSGGIASGYGVFPFFQGSLQDINAQPTTIIYHVTKVP
jgi:hypothetical protein